MSYIQTNKGFSHVHFLVVHLSYDPDNDMSPLKVVFHDGNRKDAIWSYSSSILINAAIQKISI